MRRPFVLLIASVVAACTAPDEPHTPPPAVAPADAVPVDTVVVGSADEPAAWAYRRVVEADLDADGRDERAVLAADVRVDASGRPLWEDGHRWAVWVEPAEAGRTLLYARFVPHGHVEAAVTTAGGAPRVTVFERGPQRREAWELAYDGPGRVRVVGRVGGALARPAAGILVPER